MKLPKTACAYPFKAAMLMHGQPATPCCRFHNRFLNNDKREIGQQLDPADFIRLMRQDFIGDIKDFDSTFAEVRETMMKGEWHPGCYKCKADEETKQGFRDIMLEKYLDESMNDVEEALALMSFRYEIALREEAYEECAIMKDIFDYFEYIPD